MASVNAGPAIAAAAQVGPFFTLDTDVPPRVTAATAPPWHSFEDLVSDPAVTESRIRGIRVGIAERAGLAVDQVPPRSAASLAHFGLVSRLVSPPLAAVVLAGVLPDLTRPLYWRDVLGPVPLTLPDPRGTTIDPTDTAAAGLLATQFEAGPAQRWGAAVGAVGRVSARVLTGNLASAVAGALQMLRSAAPDQARTLDRLSEGLFARMPLAGTGSFVQGRFRRASCCLYYRVPGGGYCGDCVLVERG